MDLSPWVLLLGISFGGFSGGVTLAQIPMPSEKVCLREAAKTVQANGVFRESPKGMNGLRGYRASALCLNREE